MTIPLALRLLAGSSCQPGHLGAKLPCGDFTSRATSLFGVAPGGACLASPVASPAVGSYPTVSPLPCNACARICCQMQGGLFSVALSLGLPPPGVTRHRCFMESGLSSCAQVSTVSRPMRTRDHPAIRAAPSYAQAADRSMVCVGRCVGKHAPERGGAAPALSGSPGIFMKG